MILIHCISPNARHYVSFIWPKYTPCKTSIVQICNRSLGLSAWRIPTLTDSAWWGCIKASKQYTRPKNVLIETANVHVNSSPWRLRVTPIMSWIPDSSRWKYRLPLSITSSSSYLLGSLFQTKRRPTIIQPFRRRDFMPVLTSNVEPKNTCSLSANSTPSPVFSFFLHIRLKAPEKNVAISFSQAL